MNNSKEVFQDVYRRVKREGKEVSPRGMKIIEVENFNYELPAYVRFTNFKARKLNVDYIKKEFLWYLKGDRNDLSITKHAKIWIGCIENNAINSNYGQYIFTGGQFDKVIQVLKADKDSRRASIVILNQFNLLTATKDVPCTYSMNFRIRDNKLNMSVHMRSQDAIYGMSNDAPAFSFVHEMVLKTLQIYYPELEMGSYYHIADSFHVYERHFEMLERLQDDEYTEVECPKISSWKEVGYLIAKNTPIAECTDFKFNEWLNS